MSKINIVKKLNSGWKFRLENLKIWTPRLEMNERSDLKSTKVCETELKSLRLSVNCFSSLPFWKDQSSIFRWARLLRKMTRSDSTRQQSAMA